MMFHAFKLEEDSKDLTAISTPFGPHRHNRLPMGVKITPEIAQELIECTLSDIEECDTHIDDVGVFSNDWEEHIVVLERTLTKLEDANFSVNPHKCKWAVKETDWLGHWLALTGIKPWKKKSDAILKLDCPRNTTQVRSFTGAVTFHRDMFPR